MQIRTILIILLTSLTANQALAMKKKPKKQQRIPLVPALNLKQNEKNSFNQLPEFLPQLKNLVPDPQTFQPPISEHLVNCYEIINRTYLEAIEYMDTNPKGSREWLKYLIQPHLREAENESGSITKLDYPLTCYALAIMDIKQGNYLDAQSMLKEGLRLCREKKSEHESIKEREIFIHTFFLHALLDGHLKKYHASIRSLIGLIFQLPIFYQKNTPEEISLRDEWENKAREKITVLAHQAEKPWQKLLGLALSTKHKDRNEVFKLLNDFNKSLESLVSSYQANSSSAQSDLHEVNSTIEFIRRLADLNKYPNANAIIAYIHLKQHDTPSSLFTQEKPNARSELESALKYIHLASQDPHFIQAQTMHGEIAYLLAKHLEDSTENKDEACSNLIKKLYNEASSFGSIKAKAHTAQFTLLDASSSRDAQEKSIQDLKDCSNAGIALCQDILARAYFFGSKFTCGYTFDQNLIEAHHHANSKLQTKDMIIIQALIESCGIPQKTSKDGKIIWLIQPDESYAQKKLEFCINTDEEDAYLNLHKYFIAEKTPLPMKEFLFKFVQNKFSGKVENAFAAREYALMLLHNHQQKEGIELLEKISRKFQIPMGYLELSNAYRLGAEQLPCDLAKATYYHIRALNFFDKDSVRTAKGATTLQCSISLLETLNNEKYANDQIAQSCKEDITKELEKLKITWSITEAKLQGVDSALTN